MSFPFPRETTPIKYVTQMGSPLERTDRGLLPEEFGQERHAILETWLDHGGSRIVVQTRYDEDPHNTLPKGHSGYYDTARCRVTAEYQFDGLQALVINPKTRKKTFGESSCKTLHWFISVRDGSSRMRPDPHRPPETTWEGLSFEELHENSVLKIMVLSLQQPLEIEPFRMTQEIQYGGRLGIDSELHARYHY